ncbi:DUF6531 domain-containing protein, partial [Kitasatospora sp. NPDC057512]|uniref:DUF6531 domain-containing protein n=1 Tax=Kitasatospora sp. NPDC057512 TaxID=3346154 RepID=UPI00369C1C87
MAGPARVVRRFGATRLASVLLAGALLAAVVPGLAPPGGRPGAADRVDAAAPRQHWGTAEAGGTDTTGPANQAAAVSEQAKYPPVRLPGAAPDRTSAEQVAAPPATVTGYDPKTSQELPQARGRNEVTFRNTDGTLTTQYSSAPVNYRTPEGAWAPIDTTLRPVEDTRGGWRNTADSVRTELPATLADGGQALLRYDDTHALTLGVTDAAPAAGAARGDRVEYPQVRRDADVRFAALPGGLAAELRLDSPDAPAEWTLPLRLTGLTAKADGDDLALFDEGGARRAGILTGLAEGAGGRAADRAAGVELVGSTGRPALRIKVDRGWLADPAREFPVTVAVAVDAPASNSNMVVADGRRVNDTNTLRVGRNGGYAASYLAFDGLTDPANPGNILGHKVFGAQLWLVNYDAPSCAAQPVTVHAVTEPWGAGPTGSPAFGDALASASFAHGSIAPGSSSSACPTTGEGMDLGVAGRDTVQGWAGGGAGANFGLVVRAPDDPAAWKTFTGLRTANAPRLFVTHTPYNAEYRIDDPVPHPYVTEGSSGSVKITATNRGARPWTAADYALAYRVYTADGAPVDSREAAPIPAGTTVDPGASVTFDARIHSEPGTPGSPDFHLTAGTYLIDFTMIRRNVANFIDEQIPPARIRLEVFKVPPILTDLYPPNGYSGPTLRPALWARGIHAVPGQGDLQYKVQICDHKTDGNPANTDPGCVDSGLRSDPTWTVPAGALSWNRTYWWHGWVHDSQGYSPATDPVALLTSVPQPEITSHLGGGSDDGAGLDLDPATGDYLSAAVDATVAVVGPPLTVARTYNSLDPRRGGLFGAGWSTQYDLRLTPDADGSGNVVITHPDGR